MSDGRSSGERARGDRLPPLPRRGGEKHDGSVTPGAGREIAAGLTAERVPGGAEHEARARKIAADLRGAAGDLPTASYGSGRGETVSAVLGRAGALFGRGEHAQGADLAAGARAVLSRKADNLREHAKVHEANICRYKGTPDADLAGDDAREARENAARLEWQAGRVRQLVAPPGSGTARTARPRAAALGTGPFADVAAALRQLAADVRKSPVQGTYYSDKNFPDLVPADTRNMAEIELEFAAARFDQENEPQGRAHLASACRILNSRNVTAVRGGWERLNDEHPSPADFQAEAFHHANRAGMIEDTLNAARPLGSGQRQQVQRRPGTRRGNLPAVPQPAGPRSRRRV